MDIHVYFSGQLVTYIMSSIGEGMEPEDIGDHASCDTKSEGE